MEEGFNYRNPEKRCSESDLLANNIWMMLLLQLSVSFFDFVGIRINRNSKQLVVIVLSSWCLPWSTAATSHFSEVLPPSSRVVSWKIIRESSVIWTNERGLWKPIKILFKYSIILLSGCVLVKVLWWAKMLLWNPFNKLKWYLNMGLLKFRWPWTWEGFDQDKK